MKRRKRVSIAIVLAFVFLLLSYWVTNMNVPISGEKALLAEWEFLREYICPHRITVIDSVLFVNVTYDKELRPINDENGMVIGTTDITDRKKLLKMLRYLKEQNNYKYILLDVFFANNVSTEYDKELFSLIDSMPRIVIPCHSDEKIADKRLRRKAALAEYQTTHSESDFVKYPYMSQDEVSIPVKMYEDISGNKINRFGMFYIEGWHLVRCNIVLTFDLLANKWDSDKNEKIWYNLGSDLLGDSIMGTKEIGNSLLYEVPELTNNKYIVVGAFHGDDTHSTFVGDLSGAVINYNAFVSLIRGRHIVSFSFLLVMFINFFVMSYVALGRYTLREQLFTLKKYTKNKYLQGFVTIFEKIPVWFNYSFIISVFCIISYVVFNEVYDILITATLFWGLNYFIKFYDYSKKYILWRKK